MISATKKWIFLKVSSVVLVPLIFFSIAAAFTPGPNNIIGSYSGFNFGIKKSIPLILGCLLYTSPSPRD